jgi:hypothetical protein
MLRAATLAAVLGLVAGPAWVCGQESYLVRMTKARQGGVVLVEKQEKQKKHIQVLDSAGKPLKDQQENQASTITYREKIIARPDPQARPTHLQRQFERAEHQAAGRVFPIPLQGKTYDIEKKDGRYTFQYLGGEAIPAEATQALEREFSSGLHEELDWEKLILPSHPVRANDVWELDLQQVIKVLGKLSNMQIDASRSSARASLCRIYEQDSHRFAELDAVIDLATTAVVLGNTRRPLDPGSRIGLVLKINGCIDGCAEISTVDVRLKMTTSAVPQSPKGSPAIMKVQFESTIDEKRREVHNP